MVKPWFHFHVTICHRKPSPVTLFRSKVSMAIAFLARQMSALATTGHTPCKTRFLQYVIKLPLPMDKVNSSLCCSFRALPIISWEDNQQDALVLKLCYTTTKKVPTRFIQHRDHHQGTLIKNNTAYNAIDFCTHSQHVPHSVQVKVKVKFSRYRPEQALGDPKG